eukprot:6195170-Pleurochrysis_carterae.AAC.6
MRPCGRLVGKGQGPRYSPSQREARSISCMQQVDTPVRRLSGALRIQLKLAIRHSGHLNLGSAPCVWQGFCSSLVMSALGVLDSRGRVLVPPPQIAEHAALMARCLLALATAATLAFMKYLSLAISDSRSMGCAREPGMGRPCQ